MGSCLARSKDAAQPAAAGQEACCSELTAFYKGFKAFSHSAARYAMSIWQKLCVTVKTDQYTK